MISLVVGVGLGIVAAAFRDRWPDQVIRVVSLAGVSMPTFWIALVAFYLLFFRLGWLPGGGRLDPAQVAAGPHDRPVHGGRAAARAVGAVRGRPCRHLVLPGLVLATYTIGMLLGSPGPRCWRSWATTTCGRPGQGAARARGHPPARAAARADLGHHRRRGRLRQPAVGHRAGGEHLLLARHRPVRVPQRDQPRPARHHGRVSCSSRSSTSCSTSSSTCCTASSTRGSGCHDPVAASPGPAAALGHPEPGRGGAAPPRAGSRVPVAVAAAAGRQSGSWWSSRWVVVAVFAPLIGPDNPLAQNYALLAAPSSRALVRHRRTRPRRAVAGALRRPDLAAAGGAAGRLGHGHRGGDRRARRVLRRLGRQRR